MNDAERLQKELLVRNREVNDWRHSAQVAWREITNLKRRLAFMRRVLGHHALNATLDYDTDMRRRFERAEKKRMGRP